MKTLYGPEAKDGDYVLVTNVFGTTTAFPAKVYNGKAYTGHQVGTPSGKKEDSGIKRVLFLRRTEAISVIPESYIPEETKKLISIHISLSDTERRCSGA